MTGPPDAVLASLGALLSGRYATDREIGRGGMARVYHARDLQHDRDVAIKVLDPHLGSAIGGERFLREIQLTAQLTHPNIIPVLDSGHAGDLLYYVTPFAPGESLRARLEREGQLPTRDALRIAREIADALAAAHDAGVIHRDVKPENVLLVAGHAVVCDFGIARAVSLASGDSLTATGVSLGTPSYMAPEQVVATRDVDGRADIYALGCVLYEMLAGDPPFTGNNAQRIMAQHATSPAPSVRLARPGVPEPVDHLLDRALQKAPADRFASATEMRDAIDTVLEGGTRTTGTTRVSASHPARQRFVAIGFAVAMMMVAASGWFWFRVRPSKAATEGAPTSRVAVLPMATASADPNDQSFADGMTEELISTLSRITGVRVIARSSVVDYVNTNKTSAEIGRDLGVGSIVESTYRKAGDQMHITVRLIDAASKEYRWNETYDREATLANILAIQRDIATTVAQRLSVRLMPADSARVAKQPTNNLQAYGLYVRAQLLRRDNENSPKLRAVLDTVTDLLRQAITLDSSFAEAHAALAQAYIGRLFRFEPSTDLRRLAETEVERALAIDPNLAEAYHARGDLAYTRESGWRLEDAMQDYLRAIALKPNAPEIHAAFGSFLFHLGLLDAARRELEITMMLDPVNRFVPPRITRVMWYAGQYELAAQRMAKGAGFDEEYALVRGYLGRPAEGLTELGTQVATGRDSYDLHAARAVLLARLGKRAEAEAEIRTAIPAGPPASHFHHAEFMIASAYALLGNAEESVGWLERMADDGMPNFALIENDPSLAGIRSTSLFKTFLARERIRHARLDSILSASTNPPDVR